MANADNLAIAKNTGSKERLRRLPAALMALLAPGATPRSAALADLVSHRSSLAPATPHHAAGCYPMEDFGTPPQSNEASRHG